MRPVVKWAGGKTQLLKYINKMTPVSYNTYYEPFLGGGAALLDLVPEKAVVNDLNSDLMNMYRQMQANPQALLGKLTSIDKNHELSADTKAFYYEIRNAFNNETDRATAEQAARFIYLNKHCFNGLYRVNAKGKFNVPFNNKNTGKSFDGSNFLAVSKYLKNVELLEADFEEAVKTAGKNDFVFFDSPYVPLNPTSFTDYTKEGFEYDDHIRLANLFKSLTDKGVYCMLTNHNADLVNELYKDYYIKVVPVLRSINSNGHSRKGEEVIITNYPVDII